MFVLHFFFFFWLQCIKQEFTIFLSLKNQTAVNFFQQTDYFNWWINSLRETALDIVLDVSENSHDNVYSEVLTKVVACQHGVY